MAEMLAEIRTYRGGVFVEILLRLIETRSNLRNPQHPRIDLQLEGGELKNDFVFEHLERLQQRRLNAPRR